MKSKSDLRKSLRVARRDQVAKVPESMRALVLHRPPAPLLDLVPDGATVGLYHALPDEAPSAPYARFFMERGHAIALPRFATRAGAMTFTRLADPYEFSDCEVGPFGALQPLADAEATVPDVLFVPLVGFTSAGARLGQGGGHYDRWLEQHPDTTAIGLAWDCQLVDDLPNEPHDRPMSAVVTPTRLYGPY